MQHAMQPFLKLWAAGQCDLVAVLRSRLSTVLTFCGGFDLAPTPALTPVAYAHATTMGISLLWPATQGELFIVKQHMQRVDLLVSVEANSHPC